MIYNKIIYMIIIVKKLYYKYLKKIKYSFFNKKSYNADIIKLIKNTV